jgi:hypothetical protein
LFNGAGLALPATRLSLSPEGQPANDSTYSPTLSGDGRYVSMSTVANNLAPRDDNHTTDIVRLDRQTGQFDLVSVSSSGQHTMRDDPSFKSSISADGNLIVFESWSQTLDDSTPAAKAGSPAANAGSPAAKAGSPATGAGSPASPPGQAFPQAAPATQGKRYKHIYLRDVSRGTTERISDGKTDCEDAHISADGNTVVFTAHVEEHMRGFTQRTDQIVAWDRKSRQLVPVSVGAHGERPDANCTTPVVSADGRWVAFASRATNLLPYPSGNWTAVYLRDRVTGTTQRLSPDFGKGAAAHSPAISADGAVVAYTANAHAGGVQDPLRIMLWDARTGHSSEVPDTMGNLRIRDVSFPSISGDGRYVAFQAKLPDSPSPDINNIMIFDRQTSQMRCVSVTAAGTPANDHCHVAHIAADGSAVTYSSNATNLAPVEAKGEQVFLSPNPLHPTAQARAIEAAERQARDKAQAAGTVDRHDDFVVINGVRVPRRTP